MNGTLRRYRGTCTESTGLLQTAVDVLMMGIDPRDLPYVSVQEMHEIAKKVGETIHEIRKTRDGYINGDAVKTAWQLIARSI